MCDTQLDNDPESNYDVPLSVGVAGSRAQGGDTIAVILAAPSIEGLG
jgi:hypothetical protein